MVIFILIAILATTTKKLPVVGLSKGILRAQQEPMEKQDKQVLPVPQDQRVQQVRRVPKVQLGQQDQRVQPV